MDFKHVNFKHVSLYHSMEEAYVQISIINKNFKLRAILYFLD